MIRTRFATLAVFAVLTLGAGLSRAEDQAPAAVPPAAAPADGVFKAEPAGGCMPDGSCCGHGACAHAAMEADKATTGSAAGAADSAADTSGCPCAKMKKKAM